MVLRVIFLLIVTATHFACRAGAVANSAAAARRPSGKYSLQHEGRQREYTIHLPAAREQDAALPLVIALHGAPGNANNLEENSLLSAKADRVGFIAVYPNGTSATSTDFLNWNSGSCCGYAWENKVDDVGFLRRLIISLATEYEVDKNRIYAIGFSKGGMLAYLLACEAADLFTGIAVVGGAFNNSDCRPAREIELFIAHGRKDPAIPFGAGVPTRILPLADDESRPVAYALHFWSRLQGCVAFHAKLGRGGEVTRYGCERGKLRLITFPDDGHVWPGALPGLAGSQSPHATLRLNDAVWSFWREGKKPLR